MEVVLKQDVDALGLRGDVVNVARGYARNFLLPRGLAELATPGLKRELERRDEQRARHEAKSVDEARAIAARLDALELRFDVTAGPTGSLFGSVTATNVADRLWEAEKLRVDRRKLQMETIKRIGRYTVAFEVFPDVVSQLKLVVAPEGEELPPAEELAALEAQEVAEAEAAAAAKQAAPEYLPELDDDADGAAVTPAEAAERADDLPELDAPAPAEPPEGEAGVDAAASDEPGEDEPAA